MGIRVEWYQGREDIAHYIYEPQWTWDDLWKAAEQFYQMAASVHPRIVHVFIDMSQTKTFPQNLLGQGARLGYISPDNEGLRIVIGANPIIRKSYEIVQKVYHIRQITHKYTPPDQVRFASSLDDAEKIIESVSA
jgi:hypothetical protein